MSKKENEINEVSAANVDETKPKKKFNGKKLKFGSVSVVILVLVIAIVVIFNLMCGALMKRYPIKLDLTPDNRHEITEETIGVLKDIDKDVEITVTSSKDYFSMLASQYENMFYQYYGAIVECPYDIIPEILDKYSVYAEAGKGSIKVSYIDINKEPNFVTRMSKYYSGEISEGSIVVYCNERVKVIEANEVAGMITPSQDSTQQNIHMVFAGESIITSAVRAVADVNTVKAAFVTSMNGAPILDQTHSSIESAFKSFIAKNGYDCEEIDIGSDELDPESYDVLVVAAPAMDFTEDIITKISDFLYNDGNYEKDMIYIPNYFQTELPNISAFLEDWKIKIETKDIIDDENMVQVGLMSLGGQASYAMRVNVADNETLGTLTNESLPIVAPGARAITVVSKNNESVVNELVKSYDTSYLTDGQTNDTEKSAYNVIVKSRKETSSGLSVYGSDLLVIGSAFMLDSQLLSNTNTYNNANVILNAVNETTGKEASVIIPEKTLENYTLSLSQGGARLILVIVVIVIPLLIAIAGLGVLLWRKNK